MLELTIKHTWDGQAVPPAEQVTLELSEADDRQLRIRVRGPYHGDPPPPGPPGPTIGLWEHEVVELFVLGASDTVDDPPVYTELELGPHGHQLVLRLRGVRQVVGRLLPLRYRTRIDGAVWEGEALLDRSLLPPAPHRVNAYAIHGTGDQRRYLALYPVPGEAPDFHRLEYFEEATLPGG